MLNFHYKTNVLYLSTIFIFIIFINLKRTALSRNLGKVSTLLFVQFLFYLDREYVLTLQNFGSTLVKIKILIYQNSPQTPPARFPCQVLLALWRSGSEAARRSVARSARITDRVYFVNENEYFSSRFAMLDPLSSAKDP